MQENIDNLWRSYFDTRDIKIKNKLLMHYEPLVKSIAKRIMYANDAYNELDDLVSCGTIGLMDAIEKFDAERGVKFETYASTRIRGEIIDNMRRQDWAPSSLRHRIKLINRTFKEFENKFGYPPTEEEIAASTDMSLESVNKALNHAHTFNMIYLDEVNEKSNDIIYSNQTDTTSEEIEKKELISMLGKYIENNLSEKERLVITLHYYEELTFKQIANILSITESRISQIHSKAILKLKASFAEDYLL